MSKVEIQLLDWEFDDYNLLNDSDEDEDEEEDEYTNNNKFIIRLFGRKKNGESVSVIVTDFKPFFYIKVYDWWGKKHATELEIFIRKKLPKELRECLIQTKLIEKHDMVGFTNHKKF